MSVMDSREASRKLDGRFEMDDVVYGGEKHEYKGGKRGRGGPNKVPFVAAVQTTYAGHLVRLLLHVVKTHDGESIEAMAHQNLEPIACVVSDGLGCFRAVMRIGCTHEPVVAAKTGWSEKILAFRWVKTVVGNLKTAMAGTMKHVASRYLQRYFANFRYRFNRRYDVPEILDRLGAIALMAPPRPRRLIKIAYEVG